MECVEIWLAGSRSVFTRLYSDVDSVAWSPSSPSLGFAKNEQSTLN